MLLSQTLEILTNLFSHAGPWLVVWVTLLVGVSAYTFYMARATKLSRRWVVRKGECPFCGHLLFGTTRDYQRLFPLDPVSPEIQYLCTGCDKKRIIGVLSLREEGRYTAVSLENSTLLQDLILPATVILACRKSVRYVATNPNFRDARNAAGAHGAGKWQVHAPLLL